MGNSSKKLSIYSKPIDIEKFLGPWYVHVNIPTIFEKNAFNPVESYSVKPNAKNKLDVLFTLNKGSLTGKEVVMKQVLSVSETDGNWKVSPLPSLSFIKLDYTILDIDGSFMTKENEGTEDEKEVEKYSYIVIGHPSRKYAWVMGREPTMEEEWLNKGTELLKENGFNLAKALYPQHNGAVKTDAE